MINLQDFDEFQFTVELANGDRMELPGFYEDARYTKQEREQFEKESGMHTYELRESDNGEIYHCTIEKNVVINHSGTFVTNEVLPFNENGNRDFFKVVQD